MSGTDFIRAWLDSMIGMRHQLVRGIEDIRTSPTISPPAYFSPSWTAFQADRGRDFSVIVDGVSV
jgi:hypothetical protein